MNVDRSCLERSKPRNIEKNDLLKVRAISLWFSIQLYLEGIAV